MLVVLTETYCNKVNIQITEQDDFIQKAKAQYEISYFGYIILISDANIM